MEIPLIGGVFFWLLVRAQTRVYVFQLLRPRPLRQKKWSGLRF